MSTVATFSNGHVGFVCLNCRSPLVAAGQGSDQNDGALKCPRCGTAFDVVNGIPRFVSPENYANSFGFQWNRHARTQLDSYTGASISCDRFFLTTRWPERLDGETVLEAGCGAGRFTEILAQTGARLFSFDLSTAVDANQANNDGQNVTFFQADITNIPLPYEAFDRVVCLGVLQHTPDPKAAFMNLVNFLKPGGCIAIDVYDLASHRFPLPKYWLRPVTKRLPPAFLYRLIATAGPRLLPLKRRLRRHRYGRPLSHLIPIYDYAGQVDLDDRQLQDWAILDTFDGLSAWYEKPQTPAAVREWFEEANLEQIEVGPGPNGINGRGVRPRIA
ncbi:MAG: methyltransferase domain-containing protein [Chloroflexi bacterium]|nr:methyltransferase domain-containing protein [Chloroflexota bacterium]MCI0579659.1 methyltransferase domain-containing protein [Chloroflexota bacterium]MCI0645901.1 methyltransferase domain-containing protein [Chloroflexota bacterium]MCI0725756.1 methyltransferase domain-containing protein [Chloroflexota bacterium]